MTDEPIGFVRRLTKEEMEAFANRPLVEIEPDENGNYRVTYRVVIDPKDWRGFTGTQIEKVGMGD